MSEGESEEHRGIVETDSHPPESKRLQVVSESAWIPEIPKVITEPLDAEKLRAAANAVSQRARAESEGSPSPAGTVATAAQTTGTAESTTLAISKASPVPPTEIPEVVDLLFNGGRSMRSSGSSGGRPQVIFLKDREDSSVFLLQWLLQEELRRTDRPTDIRVVEQNCDGGEVHGKAGRRSIWILEGWQDTPDYYARLREIVGAGGIAIVHHAASDSGRRIESPLDRLALRTYFENARTRVPGADFHFLEPRSVSDGTKSKLVGMLVDGAFRLPTGSFDLVLDAALRRRQRKFDDTLRLPQKLPGLYLSCVRRGEDEVPDQEESVEHFRLKLLTFAFICREKGLDPTRRDQIDTEHKLTVNQKTVVPDVWAMPEGKAEVWEIETLYGQGSLPVKKLDETVRKYSPPPPGSTDVRLNIVLPNVAFLLFHRTIMGALRVWKSERYDVRLWCVDIDRLGLVPGETLLRLLSNS